MGKKRKSKPMRPWCWYCEKDFEDDKVLVTHQRAKHFKCERCNKKLTTAGGMVVHCHQVHKLSIHKVPNALPGRDSLDVEIFGMEGIPEEDMIAHEAKISGNAHHFNNNNNLTNSNNNSSEALMTETASEATNASSNGNLNKKAKTSGSGHYGELTLEQIQQQMEARKSGVAPVAVPAAYPPPTQPPYFGYPAYPNPPQFPNQYYPPQPGFPPPPPPPQNFGYPPVPPTGIPPPFPGQWGGFPHFKPTGINNNPVPQPTKTTSPISAPTEPEPVSAPLVPPPQPSPPPPPPPQPSQSQQPPPQSQPTKPSGSTKRKATKIVLIYNNNDISPEEQRAQLEKHKVF